MISIPTSKKTFQGYLASPKEGNGPGILVLHAWWGLNDFIKSFSDRLANEGFLVLAADLFDGKIATTIEEAEKLSNQADKNSLETIPEILEFLKNHPKCNNFTVSVIGFSFGGYWACWLANKNPKEIKKVVLFYATGAGDFKDIQAKFLCHFAENDSYEELEYVNSFKESLQQTKIEAEHFVYPNTQHWFFESDRKGYFSKENANLAWKRTLDFLKS